jgi:cytidylate kinase
MQAWKERAKRRYFAEYRKKSVCDIEYIKQDIIRRDKIDSSRDASPLCIPEGA